MANQNNNLSLEVNPYESPIEVSDSRPDFTRLYSRTALTGLVLTDLIFSNTFQDTITFKTLNYLTNLF